MDASMRDALAEVEKDRSQLSGVIVSRFDSSTSIPSSFILPNEVEPWNLHRASTSVPSQRPGQGQGQVQGGQGAGQQSQAQGAGQSREGADACWSSQRDSQQQQQEQSRFVFNRKIHENILVLNMKRNTKYVILGT